MTAVIFRGSGSTSGSVGDSVGSVGDSVGSVGDSVGSVGSPPFDGSLPVLV